MTTLRTLFAIATLTVGTSVTAFAQTTEATPYRYGMNLDIAQVIAVDAPAGAKGHASTATLTYRDSSGQVQKVSYIRPNTTAANQN
ncbi:DUF2790 domain-containing protein [Pseudomonas entomophila]|uniref:DUF2790 domain-containing protein n=1 Tax=Pseudomonas entomophila TaxID=312306 RepID=UPI0023D8A14F|nr:DUF2790 domain-containing protein [Pseudomonas entomophila]MDF0734228.1 DUF2790 domain-containing protein [Pseudomonas entomophila]